MSEKDRPVRGGKLTGKWDDICTRYSNKETLKKIAGRYGVSVQAIRAVLIKKGVKRRKPWSLRYPNAQKATADKLRELYIGKSLSPRETAKNLGIGRTTVRRRLVQYGIPTRGSSEAIRLKMKTDRRFRERLINSQWIRKEIHDQAILEELPNFKEQGFRCIPIGLTHFPKPDIIAIKDNKIYAVEVELTYIDYTRYQAIKEFDDIIWVDKISRAHRKNTKAKKWGVDNG